MSSSISDSQFYDNVATIGNEINSILTNSTSTGLSSDIQEKNTELALDLVKACS